MPAVRHSLEHNKHWTPPGPRSMISFQKRNRRMNQPTQHIECRGRKNWSCPSDILVFGCVLVLPLLVAGCAQLDQMLGKSSETTEPAQAQERSSKAAATTPATTEQATPPGTVTPSPGPKPAGTAASSPEPGIGQKPTPQASVSAPPQPVTPSGVVQPSDPDSKQGQEKALAEKDSPKKEKKPRVAADKKPSKKQSKPHPPTEDASLPPLPLPSKPAAIGGSGG